MRRSRLHREEPEQEIELNNVLEPATEPVWQQDAYDAPYDPDGDVEEYGYDQEAEAHEGRFRVAMGMLDLISILVGTAVILVLVALLVTLLNWLATDITHSALLLQSGLQ